MTGRTTKLSAADAPTGPRGPLDEAAEAALIERLRAGDDSAYETLVRSYGGPMLAVARRLLGSDEDAGDALQDAFTSAFRAIGAFEGGSRLATWLHRIVVNAALMKLRTRRRRPEQSISEFLPRFLEDGHQELPAVEWQDSGADLDREELRAYVRASIQKLPENYRTVLMLRDIEELDTQQTAEILGIEPNAVKVRLHRARQALRTLLDARYRRDRS